MAETGEKPEVKDSPSVPASYLEVNCRSSSKIRRFSVGTEAGFALNLINRKLDNGLPHALYIEAVKEEEEPINFGPNSVLVSYGHGWKLQTVTEAEGGPRARASPRRTAKHDSSPLGLVDGITEVLNKRKEDEEMDSELTPTDIIKCVQSEKVRLRGVNLSGLDLSKLDMSFVDFSYACLKNVFFSHADLHCAKFRDVDAENTIFHNATLRECEFSGANLRGALLAGANLQNACLVDCSFCGADLRSAHLQTADLTNANLEGANLEGANLKGAKLNNANLQGANLQRAYLRHVNLQGTHLEGAKLDGANLLGAVR